MPTRKIKIKTKKAFSEAYDTLNQWEKFTFKKPTNFSPQQKSSITRKANKFGGEFLTQKKFLKQGRKKWDFVKASKKEIQEAKSLFGKNLKVKGNGFLLPLSDFSSKKKSIVELDTRGNIKRALPKSNEVFIKLHKPTLVKDGGVKHLIKRIAPYARPEKDILRRFPDAPWGKELKKRQKPFDRFGLLMFNHTSNATFTLGALIKEFERYIQQKISSDNEEPLDLRGVIALKS